MSNGWALVAASNAGCTVSLLVDVAVQLTKGATGMATLLGLMAWMTSALAVYCVVVACGRDGDRGGAGNG